MGILKDGDLILTDVGARKNQYVSDISRAFPVNGKFTTEQKEIYSIALKVNKEFMGLLVPGKISFEDIEAYSRRRVGEELVAAGYLGKDEDVSKYYWHQWHPSYRAGRARCRSAGKSHRTGHGVHHRCRHLHGR